MTRDELLEKLRGLKPWLEEQGIVNVRLFGSYARDEAGPDSDVDLLVEMTKPLPGSWRRLDVEKSLSETLDIKVEMVPEAAFINLRHLIAHEYRKVDHAELWRLGTREIPQLKACLPVPPPPADIF